MPMVIQRLDSGTFLKLILNLFFANWTKFLILSWYKEVDPNNPTALIPLTEKTFKYKFEATIPEPDVCTDCILARITVINVISGDYGTYVLRATSEQSIGYMSEGKVKLYQTPECQQSITNPDNKGCRSPPKLN